MTGFMNTVSIICAKSLIFQFLKAASKPCKREKNGEREALKGVKGKKRVTLLIFFYCHPVRVQIL